MCILDARHRLLDAAPADRLAHTVRTLPLLHAQPILKRCAPSQRQSAVLDAATARTHTSLYQTRLRLALYMHLYEAPRNTSLVVTMRYLAPTSLDQFGKLSTSTACAAFQDELEPREPDQDSAPGPARSGQTHMQPLVPTSVLCADDGSNSRCLAITFGGRAIVRRSGIELYVRPLVGVGGLL